MENLIVAILLYVAIVAIANCPKSVAKADTDPTAPVDYFPEVEATPEPQTFHQDLSRLGVRELYKLASKAGIKGYKKLSKGALIQALA
jgi:hypothetical protein